MSVHQRTSAVLLPASISVHQRPLAVRFSASISGFIGNVQNSHKAPKIIHMGIVRRLSSDVPTTTTQAV